MALVSAPIASHNRHRRSACAPFVSNEIVAERSHHRTLATSDAASACHLALRAVPRAPGSSAAALNRHRAKHLVLQTPQVFVLRLSLRGQRGQRLPVPASLILQLPAPPCWQHLSAHELVLLFTQQQKLVTTKHHKVLLPRVSTLVHDACRHEERILSRLKTRHHCRSYH